MFALAAACLTAAPLLGCGPAAPRADAPIHQLDAAAEGASPAAAATLAYRARLDTLAARLRALDAAVAEPLTDPTRVADARTAFAEARAAYKRVEAVVEAVAPTAAAELNGPALPEVEEEDGLREAIPPKGFQVVEALLWPEPDAAAHDDLRTAVGIVRATTERVRAYARAVPLLDAQVFDAARQELARVAVLGLAGFDSPLAALSLPEAASALDGVRALLAPYESSATARAATSWAALARTLDSAVAELRAAGPDAAAFERFDRLRFVVARANPVGRRVAEVRDALGVPLPAERRAWWVGAATLFERGALDPQAFAPGWAPDPTPELVALGRELFADPRLSDGGTRSCASCHVPSLAFTDGLARSRPLPDAPRGAPLRNAPTLHNAALQAAQFADHRAVFLEDQVAVVVRDRAEMHGSLDSAAARISRAPAHAARFAAALRRPVGALPPVGERDVRAAIAAYLRTLTALDTRVDRALRGDTAALTGPERRGFTVFMGKGKCGTCHFAPLFNGTVPPALRKVESEVIGVPSRAVWRGARVDPDVGRFGTFDAPVWRHAFKTPTVRNAAVTAPYMHNGVYRTLEEVVEFYDRGGGAGIGITLPNQTLPPDPLRLTAREKRELVAFLRALTDTTAR